MRIIRDKTPDIVIVDPFYMRAKHLSSAGDRQVASSHLEGVILATQIRITSLWLTFPSKSSLNRPVTYDFLDFDRSYFSNILCSVQ